MSYHVICPRFRRPPFLEVCITQFLKSFNGFEWRGVMNKGVTNRISHLEKILSPQKTYKNENWGYDTGVTNYIKQAMIASGDNRLRRQLVIPMEVYNKDK